MDVLNSTPIENGVLSALSPSVYEHLKPRLKRVRLEAGRTLYDLGSPSEPAWFITRGIVSYRTNTEAGDIIEAAAVGRESVVGLSGITEKSGMSLWAQVQISGEAMQIGTKALENILEQERVFLRLLFEYMHTLNEQIALTFLCNQY